MTTPTSETYGRFQINPHDRVTIGGKAMRLVYRTQDGYVLKAADGTGVSETFSHSVLCRLNANREIIHEPDFYSPDLARRRLAAPVSRLSDMSSKQRARFRIRQAFVSAFKEMEAEGLVAGSDASISKNMTELCKRAVAFWENDAPDPDSILRDIEIREGLRRKRRGGVAVPALAPIHARTLRRWLKLSSEVGAAGLADQISSRGNRNSYFSAEERELLMRTVRESYMSLNRPTKMNTFQDVKVAFHDANTEREQQGLSALRVPSREAVRLAINSLDKFEVTVARKGLQAAQKLFKPVGQGLQVDRPFERVEMDEWKIDLVSIMADAGLLQLFSTEELVNLGLDNTRSRWWVTAAIDCRTKCFVGAKLTRNPRTTAALECLRMTTLDKGRLADAVGAVSGWQMAGTAEMLVTDNGPAFKAARLSDTCADLGIVLERSIAGLPGMRGTVERVFRTAASTLLHRLNGRTFSSVLERGDHPAETRACLNVENLCFALVRWIVDIYHNTPHSGLGGRTPLEQWEADHEEGNYPLRSIPFERDDRLAFGVHLTRRVDKYGVTVLGVRYHSEVLSTWYNSVGRRDVDVRWLPNNLGAIEVKLDGEWHQLPAVHSGFEALHAQLWLEVRRSLKASDPVKLKWREDVVCKAINAIRNMNTERSLAFGLIAHDWGAKEVGAYEDGMFAGFRISTSEGQSKAVPGHYGQTLEPSEPENDGTPAPTVSPSREKPSAKRSWVIKGGDE